MASRAARDLGVRRIGTSTRYLAVGALVAGGVLSTAVAKAIPGKTSHHSSSTSTNTVTPARPAPSGGDNSGASTATTSPLTAPVQAPQQVTAPPVVSSGGS